MKIILYRCNVCGKDYEDSCKVDTNLSLECEIPAMNTIMKYCIYEDDICDTCGKKLYSGITKLLEGLRGGDKDDP